MKSVENMLQRLELAQPKIRERDRRYRGEQPLRFTVDDVSGDLKLFSINLCRLAVTAVAERMRIIKIDAVVDDEDVSERTWQWWDYIGMDQLMQSAITDALAVGSAYLVVWVDSSGRPTMTVESAEQVITAHDPITREVTEAVKRWYERDHSGAVLTEHVMHYGADEIVHYQRDAAGKLVQVGEAVFNPLGVPPVVRLLNYDRINDEQGYSVIDDMGHLVDALSKLLADMLVASEHVARPKRWATGVDLAESETDGFTADEVGDAETSNTPVESPFSGSFGMWTVESPDAKFGQLPGADLGGYKAAVDLIMQQIQAVSALPGHMVGITTNNPSSAEAIRTAEASLTARASSRIRTLGIQIELAIRMLVALDHDVDLAQVGAWARWADTATKSPAQEADAVTKVFSLGIIDREEARQKIGIEAS